MLPCFVPTLLAVLLAGCCVPSAARCAEDCAQNGLCDIRSERTGDWYYRCYAGTDAGCAASVACRDAGRCVSAENGECVRPEEVERHRCATSQSCAVWGACHPRDGFCEARTDADCEQTLDCKTQGRCTRDVSGLCAATTEAQCQGSTGCAIDGLCELIPAPFGLGFAQCGIRETGSCDGALACERYGRCSPEPLRECSEGCRVFYCSQPGVRPPKPCTHAAGAAFDACSPDGWCIRDDNQQCVPVSGSVRGDQR